jgi:hypothetical protein
MISKIIFNRNYKIGLVIRYLKLYQNHQNYNKNIIDYIKLILNNDINKI